MKRIEIALVGDFDKKMATHLALNESIEHCRPLLPFQLQASWVPTALCHKILARSKPVDGIWIVPGSPYKNDANVFKVIQFARENDLPLFGTCGGFQYMILEYAKNKVGIIDAAHEETDDNMNPVISKLNCSLKGQQEQVSIPDKSSWLFQTLQANSITAKYYCSYGVNPTFYEILNQYPLVFTAFSPTGEVRAFELSTHRFFNGTLFQPSLDSTPNHPNPLIAGFIEQCA